MFGADRLCYLGYGFIGIAIRERGHIVTENAVEVLGTQTGFFENAERERKHLLFAAQKVSDLVSES